MIKNFRKIYEGVYRSGRLGKNPGRKLDRHNIKLVIDLRYQEEIDEAPDVLPSHIEYLNVPLLQPHDMNLPTDFSNYLKGDDYFSVYDTYKQVSEIPEFKANTYKVVEILENHDFSKGGVLFHCHSGKDRTGVVSAIFLRRKGFTRAEIDKDYIRTNRKYRFAAVIAYLFVLLRSGSHRKAVELYRFFHVKKDYIDLFLDAFKD
ncbi:MAG: tyrosine-protein phosphatase [Bacilli bacterium]|nr:tyrosine-protein phosphatase [Bacilli bacterium]